MEGKDADNIRKVLCESFNSILMTRHYPDLGSTPDWSKQFFNQSEAHQYRISSAVPETLFRGKTSGSFVAKCWLFSKAKSKPTADSFFSLFIILGFLATYFIARARALTNQEMTLL